MVMREGKAKGDGEGQWRIEPLIVTHIDEYCVAGHFERQAASSLMVPVALLGPSPIRSVVCELARPEATAEYARVMLDRALDRHFGDVLLCFAVLKLRAPIAALLLPRRKWWIAAIMDPARN